MPPKKRSASSADADAASGQVTWKWTPENDRTLFLMIMSRFTLGRDDYEKMAAALSPLANWNGVRQRIGKFRQDQKKKFEELGWDLHEGVSGKGKAGPAPSKKRKVGGEEGGEEMPVKKVRTKKSAKSEDRVQDGDDEEAGAVKKEEVADEVF